MRMTRTCHKAFYYARMLAEGLAGPISSVDLIYGIIVVEDGFPSTFLKKKKVKFKGFDFPLQPFGEVEKYSRYSLDSSAMLAVRAAISCAHSFSHKSLTTTHIFYGTLCDELGPARGCYMHHKLDIDILKEKILSELK